MQKKNEKILEKIVKRDYNNELEAILEKKYFSENTKNILLNILYKIETSYKDYMTVKREVESKDKLISKLLNEIKENCEEIILLNTNEEASKTLKNKSFLVEKSKKRILCYPIERKLLYCISKISNKEKILNNNYFIIEETLSDLINVGSNINSVEPIRDFNGYSWTTLPREIESIEHNLIYQNLLLLVGSEFLGRWTENKVAIIDYMETFTNKLEKMYGEKLTERLINLLKDYSILLAVKYDKKAKEKIFDQKRELEEKLKTFENSREFVEEITKTKRELTKEIKRIDETINNKELIQIEYEKRNKKLPLEKKIFSIRILAKLMEEEREEKINKIEELNVMIKPQQFVKYKQDIEEKYSSLKIIEEDTQEKIEEIKLKIQKIFLKCFKKKIEEVENKQDLLKLIYEFRYYTMLNYDYEKGIRKIKALKQEIEQIEKQLISKAHEMKLIVKLSKQKDIDYELLKNIFRLRIIKLEEINIMLAKEKENYFIKVFDGDSLEEKEQLIPNEEFKYKDLYIRYNKKVKIFY